MQVLAQRPSARARVSHAWLSLTAILAALCLALPAQLVHFVLASHTVCVEHGELVHGPEAPRDGHMASAAGERQSETGVEGGTPSEHEHEHCRIAAQGRDRLCLERASCLLAAGPDESFNRLAPCAHARVRSSERVYLFAPKTSPPRA